MTIVRKMISNKLLRICLSLLLCLILIFTTQISQTLEVHALVLVDDAVYFAIACAALWFGVTIATDSEAQQAVSDWFYSIPESIQWFFTDKSSYWVEGVNTIVEWTKDELNAISSYMSQLFENPNVIGTVVPSGEKIGFTSDTSFSITFGEQVRGQINTFDFGNSEYRVYNCVEASVYSLSYDVSYIPGSSVVTDVGKNYLIYELECKNDNFKFVYIDASTKYNAGDTATFYQWGDTLNSPVFDSVNTSGTYTFTGYRTAVIVYGFTRVTSTLSCFFTDGTEYYFIEEVDGGYAFVNQSDGTYYYDKTFFTNYYCVDYFLNQCGLATYSNNAVDVYNPSAWSPIGIVNQDVYNGRLSEIESMAEDDTVSMVLPGTTEKLEEMQANPDLVTDVTAEDVYTAGIPAIDTSPALWQTKFPFCLPWDLYDLFTGASTAEAVPKFDILIMPKDAFGLGLDEDIYISIDLTDFEWIVKIFRFFFGAEFVLFLIIISRKLIGGE